MDLNCKKTIHDSEGNDIKNPSSKEMNIKKMDDDLTIIPGEKIENIKCDDVLENEIDWVIEFGEKLVAKCALSGGAGLAATQVGIRKKLFAWMFKEGLYQIAINPKFYKDGKISNIIEGCLSYPGKNYLIKRYKYIRAVYYTINKNTKKLIKVTKKLRGESAIIFQHETDHCNGITIAQKGKLIREAIASNDENLLDVTPSSDE